MSREFDLDWQKGYEEGLSVGIENERNRIIKLLDVVEYPNGDATKFQTLSDAVFDGEMTFGEYRNQLIALIKGENKHIHELDVFGAPCDCGTRHEYCNNCDWVEPCEPDFIKGENK
jgi:hypothetical protein